MPFLKASYLWCQFDLFGVRCDKTNCKLIKTYEVLSWRSIFLNCLLDACLKLINFIFRNTLFNYWGTRFSSKLTVRSRPKKLFRFKVNVFSSKYGFEVECWIVRKYNKHIVRSSLKTTSIMKGLYFYNKVHFYFCIHSFYWKIWSQSKLFTVQLVQVYPTISC